MSLEIEKVFLTNEFTQNSKDDVKTDSTDVIVSLTNGEKYIASFFAYDNIRKQELHHQRTGEFLFGKYFQYENMILVADCSHQLIQEVIHHLIDEGNFKTAFKLISNWT